MAYPRRPIQTGATYYVTSRCINFEPYLGTDAVKELVLMCITKTQVRYSFELASFGIMDNQIKMMIRTTDDLHTISKILQHLKSLITRSINRKMFRRGTIWNERFISEMVDVAVDVIDNVKMLIFGAMYNFGAVADDVNPRKNRFNSIFTYTGEGYPPSVIITPHPVFATICASAGQFYAGFREFEIREFLHGLNDGF